MAKDIVLPANFKKIHDIVAYIKSQLTEIDHFGGAIEYFIRRVLEEAISLEVVVGYFLLLTVLEIAENQQLNLFMNLSVERFLEIIGADNQEEDSHA